MQNNKTHNFFLFIIFAIMIILVYLGQYKAVNLLYLIICSLFLIYDRHLLILIYIITLPTNGFISTEYNLFGFLHVSYIINLFATVAVFIEWRYLPADTINEIQNSNNTKKFVYHIVIFLLLYHILTDYRLRIT